MNKVLSKALVIFLYVRLILRCFFFYFRSQGDLAHHFLNCVVLPLEQNGRGNVF